jgi:hypothetical protein
MALVTGASLVVLSANCEIGSIDTAGTTPRIVAMRQDQRWLDWVLDVVAIVLTLVFLICALALPVSQEWDLFWMNLMFATCAGLWHMTAGTNDSDTNTHVRDADDDY